MKSLAVFISGEGTNLQAIIDSINNGIIPDAKIDIVVSNRENANGLKRAAAAGIKTQVEIFDKDNETRREYDNKLRNLMNEYKPDLIILAGWMHIFTRRFINSSYMIINLHPALPGKFPGKDSIKQAYEAFQRDEICETGIMVHEVVENVDAGRVINIFRIPIYKNDSLDSLTERVRYFEKPTLIRSIIELLRTESLTVSTGKVRDIYNIDYNALMISHSDRLSSFDRHICDIEWKGIVLNLTSTWWFKLTKHIIPNHLLYSDSNVMIVKKCVPFPVEVVVRGYITGNTKTSLWTHYNNGSRTYCGIEFPDGLVKNQKLEKNVITPTTKGEVDEPISPKEIVSRGLMSQQAWDFISNRAELLFSYGQAVAAERGLILVDTKYEFGMDTQGNILLIDEIHTCDSSRYWIKNSYKKLFKAGKEPEKLDKDVVRDYVKTRCDPYSVEKIPEIPQEYKDKVSKTYIKFYEQLTNTKNVLDTWEYKNSKDIYDYYFENIIDNFVVIIAGSTSDTPHVKKIKEALEKFNIYSIAYAASAHKQTKKLLELLEKYEARMVNGNKSRIVFITVAGRSNALSGVVACNCNYPIIACPPFKDKTDMTVNINSTLQMPSNVPVMTILDPGNAAIAVKRMLEL